MDNPNDYEPARFYLDIIQGGRIVVKDREHDDRQCGYAFDDEEEAVKYATYLSLLHRKQPVPR